MLVLIIKDSVYCRCSFPSPQHPFIFASHDVKICGSGYSRVRVATGGAHVDFHSALSATGIVGGSGMELIALIFDVVIRKLSRVEQEI